MFERFTDKARAVVKDAVTVSKELEAKHVGTEHLLLALITSPGLANDVLTAAGVTSVQVRREIEIFYRGDADALETIGIDLGAVRAKIEEAFGPGALDPDPPKAKRGWFGKVVNHVPFTARSKKVLELSLREAIAIKHNYIGTEHILLGLIREGKGLGAKVLSDSGVDLNQLREQILAAVQVKP
jgi:ATP-dependent Clp protease ATP-binding subunit ClpA